MEPGSSNNALSTGRRLEQGLELGASSKNKAPCSRRRVRGAFFEALSLRRRLVRGEAPCWRHFVRGALFEASPCWRSLVRVAALCFFKRSCAEQGQSRAHEGFKKNNSRRRATSRAQRALCFFKRGCAEQGQSRARVAFKKKKGWGREKVERSTPKVFSKEEQGQRPTAVITWLFQKASASRVAFQQTTARTRAWRQNKR